MKTLLLTCVFILAACCPDPIIIPMECPQPAELADLNMAPIDTSAAPSEKVREIIIRLGQCMEYADKAKEALEAYKQ